MQYTPIKALAPNFNDWQIKARITKKYDKKFFKRDRGQGQLLNIDLIDGFGTPIQATFFNDTVDKFFNLLKENSVYLFSNGEVRLANKKFSAIKNDYCIVFNINAEITSVGDDQ
jgi:replication factor A1